MPKYEIVMTIDIEEDGTSIEEAIVNGAYAKSEHILQLLDVAIEVLKVDIMMEDQGL